MTAAIYPTFNNFAELVTEVADVIVLTEDAQRQLRERLLMGDDLPEGAKTIGREWSYHCPRGIAAIESAYYGIRR